MKHQLKLVFLFLICIAVGYTACTKSSITRSSNMVAPKVVSNQIALNLKQMYTANMDPLALPMG